MDPRESFFAQCAPGLEPLLQEELRGLRLARVERQTAGCAFEGTPRDAWRANLELRTAVRVLWRVARFPAANAGELRAGLAQVDWSRFVRPDGSLLVRATSWESALDHTLFVAQAAKDVVVDQLRARTGRRPDVDKEDPDLGLHVHLARDRCTLSIDTSGEPLFKRGWRRFQGRAPLSEALAAACVLFSGWDRRAPLVDPFCGSATILIEAALIAGGFAPGRYGRRYAFERLPGHDAAAWRALAESVRSRGALPRKLALRGCDEDSPAVEGALENVRAAGFEGRIQVERGRAEDFPFVPGWNAWIVTNPPFGRRLGAKPAGAGPPAYLRRFGERLRRDARGYHLALLSEDERPAQALGFPAEQGDGAARLLHGGLECRLLRLEIP